MEVSQLRQGENGSRILLALDGVPIKMARQFATELASHSAGGKVNNLIDQHGVNALRGMEFALRFYDAKIKDIRQTVQNRLLEYRTDAHIVTIHADMSAQALETAARTAELCGFAVVAVTLLTDISPEDCRSFYGVNPEEMVHRATIRARDAGVHGIVCSPKETRMVREIFPKALIINPGVRLEGSDHHDQARVGTPEQAIRDGADLLVVGRDILGQELQSERLQRLLRYNTAVNNALALA